MTQCPDFYLLNYGSLSMEAVMDVAYERATLGCDERSELQLELPFSPHLTAGLGCPEEPA